MTSTLAFGWVNSDAENGIAIALRNAETVVYGNGSSRPSPGDLLTAMDGTHMIWQPPVGAGWPTVLGVDATTGAHDPVISSGRKIDYVDKIDISSQLINSSIQIGNAASSSSINGVAIGYNSVVGTTGGTTIGANANTGIFGTNGVAIGISSSVTAQDGTAIGNSAVVGHASSVAIGQGSTTTSTNQIMMGTSAFDVKVPGSLTMPINLAVGELTKFITLSKVLGTPTGAAASGVVAYDSSNNLFYGRNNAAWVQFQTSIPGLSSVLAVSNTSGANDISMDAGRAINYSSNLLETSGVNSVIRLGNATIGSGTNSITIGNSASTDAVNDSISIGVNARCTHAGSVAFGPNVVTTAVSQIRMGTSTMDLNVQGSLTMSSALAVGETTRFIKLTGISGTPSGAATAGVLAYDSTNNLFYGRNNAAWVQFQTSAPTLSSVLTAGNTTGANNISVNSTQSIAYAGDTIISNAASGVIKIGNATTGSSTSSIALGNSASATGASAISIGASATNAGASAFSVLGTVGSSATASIGMLTTCNAPSAIAIRGSITSTSATGCININGSTMSAAVTNNINIGTNSACSSTDGICIGRAATASGTSSIALGAAASCSSSATCIAIGPSAIHGTGCTNSILIGSGCTSLNSITGAIGIGAAVQNVSIDSIAIGRATSSSGQNSINIGVSVANHANNSNCVLVGGSVSNVTSGNTGNVVLGQGCTITAGANSIDCCVLGRAVTLPAGVSDQFYMSTTFAAATAAAGTTLSIDASGRIHPNTSSIKYKQNVKDLDDPERIYKLRAVSYNMRKGSCGCPDRVLNSDGESVDNDCDGIRCGSFDVGLIAEEVANAGMSDFVVFAPDDNDPSKKQCRSIKYDRLVGPIIEVLKIQKGRIEFLDDENRMLLDKVTLLESGMDDMKNKLDFFESRLNALI